MPWCMSNMSNNRVATIARGDDWATHDEVKALAAEVKRSREFIRSIEEAS